ncbi:hypothetical protein [Brevibacillus massiliensis]|uniref:hypothetical protein n=1 Tax=Brevibacillus massiliensis TaxID=1118054 RepID=UPI000316D255|nr:hypothetical protein [Brevibacillus massiliensis]
MSDDLTSNVLKKLSKKTGREWTMEDVFRLAEKLTELSDESLDAVLAELETMGLDIPKETKSKVKRKIKADPTVPVEEINNMERQLEEVAKKLFKRRRRRQKKQSATTTKRVTAAKRQRT